MRMIHVALALGALGAAQPAAAQQSPLVGGWGGALEAGAIRLRLTLTVADSAGTLYARFVSVDQDGSAFPATVEVHGDSAFFEAAMIGARYRAERVGRDTLRGQWLQGAGALPLTMVRGADVGMVVRRPQLPRPPFPYREEPVTVQSVPGVTLAGTLTLPPGAGPHPAVLLVSGSGPQDRDETLLGHKPFLVLADYLARRGIAVLRLDDRGVGASTGAFAAATSDDFARDAQAAVRWLRARADVADDRVGIVGHSEGGLIAPLVASRTPEVGFIVMLAGPGTPSAELLMAQGALISRAGGESGQEIERTVALQRELFTAIATEADSAALHARLTDRVRRYQASLTPEERARPDASDATLEAAVNQLISPWYRWFLRYDPAPALRATRVPVLALNGSLDLQVPADENLAAIRRALQAGGNRDVTVEKLPGLNHLFQTARTGAPSEYAEIEETFSPAALQRIGDWIVQRFGPRP
ncbi:alpha/beta hydrolase family protein [Longimicrobium sp.]|uniref:alpha/beta hydrolase family protein n=1 Tax=Longimicrobium sp. TaxID=2029185 RepID=UPI003B3A41AF